MATQKKNPDASEAGLSAVEEALGLGSAPPAEKNPDSPRLPRVDDIDIFKPEKPAAGEPAPQAKLEIKPPQRKAKPEKTPASEEADFSVRRDNGRRTAARWD